MKQFFINTTMIAPNMTYHLLALFVTIAAAVNDILMRAFQRERDQSWLISVVGSFLGAVVLIWFTPLLSVNYTIPVVSLLALSGFFWSMMIFWDFKSQAFADASVNAIISSSRTVLLIIAGILIFDEKVHLIQIVSGVLIITGILISSYGPNKGSAKGMKFRVMSVLAGAIAITVDKILIGMIDIRVVMFLGYLLPGIFWTFFRPTDWRAQLVVNGAKRGWMFAGIIALYIGMGPPLIYAFGQGTISATFLITQTRSLFVFLLAVLILKEREAFTRRLISAVLCSVGLVGVLLPI